MPKKDDKKEAAKDDKKPPFVDRVLQKAVDQLKTQIEKQARPPTRRRTGDA